MKIYLDLELILNFSYDLILLMTIDITLKRHIKLVRLILASIFGALSIVILFLSLPKTILFILKIVAGIIMSIIAFSYKNIKYTLTNLMYLYMCSVILGGFLYLLKLEFNTKFSINYVLLLVLAPLILFIYIKEHIKYKSAYNFNCKVEIVFLNNKSLFLNGFIDSGNKLRDPISKKYVILVSKKLLKGFINIRSPIYVPYRGINKSGIVKCFKVKYIKVNGYILNNYLVGIMDNEISNSEVLLNYKIMEDICLEK